MLALLLLLQLHTPLVLLAAPVVHARSGDQAAPRAQAPAGSQAPAAQQEVIKGEGRPTATIPRIDAAVAIDGHLDEPAWSQAARLGGFWQYQPVDGRHAEEQTEVLVWYSPEAIHFGIVAHDTHAESIRATVADRDNLDRDDTVTIFLDTFNDRRRAFFFTVNPLGVQQDGVQTEGGGSAGHFMGFAQGDRNPDYQFDSKGVINETGYVVEVRIPFKSLRYPGSGPQTWGLNIQRKVQRTGHEDTWTDVRRASSSFLGQAGAIDGLHEMKRGVVTEIQPFLAAALNRERDADGAFDRATDYTPGVNVRIGFTNVSVDATVNPDFSQVESDAGQVTVNERFALFYPEKRPFFLEGNELFSTPNQLVYTRKIVQPIAGGKLTGKVGRTTFAYLLARDRAEGGDATFNIARVRRDIGRNSVAGVTFTDRTSAAGFNRVIAADARITFAKLFFVEGQAGEAWTEETGVRRSSPGWSAVLDCTGRSWGCHYELLGMGPHFETQSGFVSRNDFVQLRAMNRLTWYGSQGAPVQDLSVNFHASRFWDYETFTRAPAIEGGESVRISAKMRGGWEVQGMVGHEFVRFDPAMYAGYQVLRGSGIEAYQPPARFSGFTPSVEVTTPVYRRFNASLEVGSGGAPIFAEASNGLETRVSVSLGLRPTESLRGEVSLVLSSIHRARDDSEFARTIIPRVKVEYQPKRSLFVRLVAEYRSERQAMLRDAVTGDPLLTGGMPFAAESANGLRIDALFSYEPTPGTVVFFGYGSSLDADRTFSLRGMERRSDGFFLKLAYQIRR